MIRLLRHLKKTSRNDNEPTTRLKGGEQIKKRWKSENLDEFFISIFTRELCALSVVVSREDYTIIVNNVVCCSTTRTTHETHSWVGGLFDLFSSAFFIISVVRCCSRIFSISKTSERRLMWKIEEKLKITSGNNSFVFRVDTIQLLLLLRNEIIHTTTTQLNCGGS